MDTPCSPLAGLEEEDACSEPLELDDAGAEELASVELETEEAELEASELDEPGAGIGMPTAELLLDAALDVEAGWLELATLDELASEAELAVLLTELELAADELLFTSSTGTAAPPQATMADDKVVNTNARIAVGRALRNPTLDI